MKKVLILLLFILILSVGFALVKFSLPKLPIPSLTADVSAQPLLDLIPTDPETLIEVPAKNYYHYYSPFVPNFGIQPFYQHQHHCELHNAELLFALNECNGTGNTPPVGGLPHAEANCTSTTSCRDGATLWKPISESTGDPVLLTDPSYQYAGIDIYPINPNQRIVRRHCCYANGDRHHAYFSTRINGPTTIKFSDGRCITVPDASERCE